MSYNYLELVNSVLMRVNEVVLSSSNFASATGFYSDAKNAVNLALSDINTQQWEWPFNHTTETLTLTVDQVRYDFPALARSVDFDTFRVVGDEDLGVITGQLFPIDYEDYLEKYSDMEYQPENYHTVPTNVFKTKTQEFGIIPPPDETYDVDYEYYSIPVDLEDYDDVPTVPETFKNTIHTGAMKYAYMFRGELEAAAICEQLFSKQINNMRAIFIPGPEYIRSTMIEHR
jgi:hypothetical protein